MRRVACAKVIARGLVPGRCHCGVITITHVDRNVSRLSDQRRRRCERHDDRRSDETVLHVTTSIKQRITKSSMQ